MPAPVGDAAMGLGPDLPDATDILVVGGGIAGTASAFALSSRTDRDVTLVERDSIAAGATGDSSAILRHAYGANPLYTRMAREGHDFYRDFAAHTGADLTTVGQPLLLWGGEGVSPTEAPMASYQTLSSLGLPVARYEAADIPTEFPHLDVPGPVEFAVSDVGAGYTDGTDAATGFARAAADNGVRIVTGHAVESILVEGSEVVGARTTAGDVACDDLVVAAGAWTHRLTATAGVELPVRPGREQVLLLEPPAALPDGALASLPTTGWTSDRPDGVFWYVRPDFGDTIFMGTHARVDPVDPDTYRRRPDEARVTEAAEILATIAPGLADAAIVGEYCGVYANTPDRGFILDQVGPAGLYAFVGAGHAFKHGPVVGRLVADLVLDAESRTYDLERFAADRFDDDPWAAHPGLAAGEP